MPGRRRASIVLPDPGGPTRSRLWPPAAAISSARRARPWPRTSARSASIPGPPASGAGAGVAAASSSRPRIESASWSVAAGWTERPGAIAASEWFAAGTIAAARRSRSARSSVGRTPATGRSDPSSASSPTSRTEARWCGEAAPSAARRPTAVARSKDEPYFRRLAGARLTVIRRSHLNGIPQFRRAARIRASLSFTAESARPTMVKRGNPGAESASTRTRWASTPRTAAVSDVASMALSSLGGGRGPFGFHPTRGSGRGRSDRSRASRPWRGLREQRR